MSDPKVLLVSGQSEFVPILKSLATEGWGFVTPDRNFFNTLKNLELPVRHIQEFSDGELADRAFTEAQRLLARVNSHTSPDGLSPGPAQFIQSKAAAFVTSRVVDLCALMLTLDRIKPAVVLLHNDVEPVTRACALWAQARSVPCLHSPHAVYQDVNRGPAGTDVHDLITASHLAAAGPFQRAWYELRGFPTAAIRETGLVQYDRWYTPNVDRFRARRLLKVFEPGTRTPAMGTPVVTYCSTWPQNTNLMGFNDQWVGAYMAWIEAVKQLRQRYPRLVPIIKCHPRGGQDNWKWHYDQAKGNGLWGAALIPGHVEIVMSASDVVVAFGGSNVLVEASFVPTVRALLTTHGYEDDEAVGKVAMEPGAMVEAIEQGMETEPPDFGAFRHKWAGPADGKAAERVTEWLRELVA